VALGIGLESIGIPAPGETILVIAAAAAATGTGKIVWVILAAAAGAIIGDNIAFHLGRRRGRAILQRVTHLGEERLARSEAFFNRHGPKTVFIARFIPVVRSVSAYLAGINRMSPRTFAIYNLAGGLTWAVVIGSLGYVFGKNLPLLESVLHRVGGVLMAILLVGVFVLWLNHRWRQSERNYQAGRIGVSLSWLQARWQRIVHEGRRGLLLYGLLLLVSGWATGVLLDDWVQNEPELYRRDRLATQWLQIGVEEVPDWVEGIAFVSDVRVLAGIAGLTAVWLWQQKRRRLSLLSVLNFVGALALGWGLQVWLKRPLPPAPEPLWQLTAYSFPHLSSLMAVAVLGWLAYVWGHQRNWSSQVNAGTAAAFVIASISITGLYLAQAHLSDVLAGLSIGLLWLGIPLALAHTEVGDEGRQFVDDAEV
jgi:membrane protein DedA with SNARE-associated domain